LGKLGKNSDNSPPSSKPTGIVAAAVMAGIVIFLLLIPVCSNEGIEKILPFCNEIYRLVVIPIIGVITFFGINVISGSYRSAIKGTDSTQAKNEEMNKSITRRSIAATIILMYVITFTFVMFGQSYFQVTDFVVGDKSELTEKNLGNYFTVQNETKSQLFKIQDEALKKFQENSNATINDILKYQNGTTSDLLKFFNQTATQTMQIQEKINDDSKSIRENENSLMGHFLWIVSLIASFYFVNKYVTDFWKVKYGKSPSTPSKPKTIGDLIGEKTPTLPILTTSEVIKAIPDKIKDKERFILLTKDEKISGTVGCC